MRWSEPLVLLACLLAGCGGGGGGPLYLVFEELSPGNAEWFVSTEDGRLVWFDRQGGLQRWDEGEAVSIQPDPHTNGFAMLEGEGLFASYQDGYAFTRNGDTWTEVEPTGLPDPVEWPTHSMRGGLGSIWALVKQDTMTFQLYRSRDQGATFEYVFGPVINYVGIERDSLRITALTPEVLTLFWEGVHAEDGPVTQTFWSEDEGETWFTGQLPDELRVPELPPTNGITLQPGRASEGGIRWTRNWEGALADSSLWGDVRIYGTPPSGQVGNLRNVGPALGIDSGDRLVTSVGGSIYRTEHVISRQNPGRGIALAGPGCGRLDGLYEDSDGSAFASEHGVTVANAGSDPLDIWNIDNNQNWWPIAVPLQPGEDWTDEDVGVGAYILATDERGLCRGLQLLDTAGETLTFQ